MHPNFGAHDYAFIKCDWANINAGLNFDDVRFNHQFVDDIVLISDNVDVMTALLQNLQRESLSDNLSVSYRKGHSR